MNNKPDNYGTFWNQPQCSEQWYDSIRTDRTPLHNSFMSYVSSLTPQPESVLEVGCGRSSFYPKAFKPIAKYSGCDISTECIKWCSSHHPGTFICGDITEVTVSDFFDLVFSHAVIDHVPDIDLFLKSLAVRSSRDLFISSYRGWFPYLSQHQYRWSPPSTCFYNKISPSLVESSLRSYGFQSVQVTPLKVNSNTETIIIARR